MPAVTDKIIGLGLYAPPEAALYARVSTANLSRWVFGTGACEPVIQSELTSEHRIVTFLDFAQTLSVCEIRLSGLVSLQKIRDAYKRAQEEHDIRFPFAREHGIFVFGNLSKIDRCEIGIYIPRADTPADRSREKSRFVEEHRKAVQLTGRHKGQVLISQIVRPFSKNLVYHEQSGLASEYVAFESHGHRILMDPNVRFGKPCIENTGYEAETLAEAARIEKGPTRAAKIYEVEETAVLAALDFYKHLKKPPPRIKPSPVAA
jgi:uncharacterized protein (DUF433 family)